MNKSRILVTGGTGSIGPRLLPRLLDNGWEVLLAGRSASHSQHPRLQWKETDLSSSESARGLSLGCDTVLHMANLSKSDPEGDYRASDLLAREAVASGARHFFYVSSIRVYGSALGTIDESEPPRPAHGDAYAENKLRIEKRLGEIFTDSPTRLRILRVGHVLSPKSVALTPAALSLPYLLLWGRGYPHFIHVDDVASAILYLLDSRESLRSRIYNITRESECEATFNDFYSNALPSWQRQLCQLAALPLSISHFVSRNRPEARTTRTARILEANLIAENWRYSGDALGELLQNARASARRTVTSRST